MAKRETLTVTREQFQRLEALVEENTKTLAIQFQRIAQIQADLDLIQKAWDKLPAPQRCRS